MQAKDIMTKEPACCTPETSLKEVAAIMCQAECGEVPVVESFETMKPVGVLTDRDIACRTVSEGKNPYAMKAGDCMSSPFATVHPETGLEECLDILESNEIRRVPVVDSDGRCCGTVAQADIVAQAPGILY